MWLQIRCMECKEVGHLKCTSERRSLRLPVDPIMKDNLDEFIVDASKKLEAFDYVRRDDDTL